ncbi:MAG: hypothetical protein AB1631_06090 [Acidobacteriota bacterium]
MQVRSPASEGGGSSSFRLKPGLQTFSHPASSLTKKTIAKTPPSPAQEMAREKNRAATNDFSYQSVSVMANQMPGRGNISQFFPALQTKFRDEWQGAVDLKDADRSFEDG